MPRPALPLLNHGLAVALCAAALVLLHASPAEAQWKWKDARGQLHVSDRPPPADVPESSILQRPAAPSPRAVPAAPASPAATAPASDAAASAAPTRPGVDPALEARRQAAEQERQAREAAERDRATAARAENCNRARAALQSLDSGQRVWRTNAQGEREFLDDAQRQREADRARQSVAANCSG